jgi:hypothetical protein
MMWEHRTVDNQIFGRGKVYYSNSIIITTFMQTLIPSCSFEIPYQNFQMLFREFIEYRVFE